MRPPNSHILLSYSSGSWNCGSSGPSVTYQTGRKRCYANWFSKSRPRCSGWSLGRKTSGEWCPNRLANLCFNHKVRPQGNLCCCSGPSPSHLRILWKRWRYASGHVGRVGTSHPR